MKSLIIIPARMQSTRLPGKPLVRVGSGTLLDLVYAAAKKTSADHVVVATPDREIAGFCLNHEYFCVITSTNHSSGAARCAEAMQHLVGSSYQIDVVVDFQCDEPSVDSVDIDRLMRVCYEEQEITTLVAPLNGKHATDSNVVKVAVGDKICHWFSRALMAGTVGHCGVYAFPPDVLAFIGKSNPTNLSTAESLEQLSWIQRGHTIEAVQLDNLPLSINTPEDLKKLRELHDKAPASVD